jgi:hypothetical protein
MAFSRTEADAALNLVQSGDLRALVEVLRRHTSNPIVNLTAATLTLNARDHDLKTITVNVASGSTLTLPAAVGSGFRVKILCGTTITSNDLIVQVADATDVMTGGAWIAQDAADTVVMFETASTSDTITMDGTTTGGIKGDMIELEDVASNLWWVRVMGSATSTEATPFSAAVS